MKKLLPSKISLLSRLPRCLIKRIASILLVGLLPLGILSAQTVQNPPGVYSVSWLGNSFAGGNTQWVQDAAQKMLVSPDGTLFAGSAWDEEGRCVGLYKNGTVNSTLLKENSPPSVTWGWGTASRGIGLSGNYIYDATAGGGGQNPPVYQLVTFSWTPGSINTAKNVGTPVTLSTLPTGLCASGDTIAILYGTTLEVRNTYDIDVNLGVVTSFTVGTTTQPATDVAIASDGSFWVLTGPVITHYSSTGTNLGVTVPGLTDPVSVAFDNSGRLVVCDNGTYQVKFFNISGSGTPTLATTFGIANGLLSGTPGAMGNLKFFNLVGAGTDSTGNIYVAMSFDNEPNQTPNAHGTLYLQSHTASGTLNWSLFSGTYINTCGFDPTTDGQTVYSPTGIYSMNYNNTVPGTEASLLSVTLDTKNNPTDPRGTDALSMRVVYPTAGHMALYGQGQQAGGYNIFAFQTAGSKIASFVDGFGGTGYAWDVDSNGGIWRGDAGGNLIRYYPFQSWNGNIPVYNTSVPTTFPWPSIWGEIDRVRYIPATDTLYISGYLPSQTAPTWGLMGASIARYDGWLAGNHTTYTWLNQSLPLDEKGYPPKAMDVAGNYIFMPSVATAWAFGPSLTHILDASTGAYVGAFQPGTALGTVGAVDTIFGVSAFQRANGEYEIFVEDDGLAKQILYRWSPLGLANGTYTLTPGCATGSHLDDYNGYTSSGSNVDIWATNTNPSEVWTITNVGANVYKLQPTSAPTLCLNVVGGSSGNGTNVDIETDTGASSERWTLIPVTGGYVFAPLCATSARLDVYGGLSTNGTNVDIWGANGNSSQRWTITAH